MHHSILCFFWHLVFHGRITHCREREFSSQTGLIKLHGLTTVAFKCKVGIEVCHRSGSPSVNAGKDRSTEASCFKQAKLELPQNGSMHLKTYSLQWTELWNRPSYHHTILVQAQQWIYLIVTFLFMCSRFGKRDRKLTPAPIIAALKRSVCVTAQADMKPPWLQPPMPRRSG